MMALLIYLFGTVQNLFIALHLLTWVTLAAFALTVIIYSINNFESDYYGSQSTPDRLTFGEMMKRITGWFKVWLYIAGISAFLLVFTPSPKVMAAMYLIPKMVDAGKGIAMNEQVRVLPDKIIKLFNAKLDS